MASVTFGRLWLNPADDLAAGRSFRLHEITAGPSLEGEFNRYAGGRIRLITRAGGAKQTHQVKLKHCDRAAIDQLEDWIGRVLLVRDPDGRRFFGAYLQMPVEERIIRTGDVSLTFTEVTVNESV